MDPDAALDELLRLSHELLATSRDPDVLRVAELILALDAWLKRSGFLPDRWNPSENA